MKRQYIEAMRTLGVEAGALEDVFDSVAFGIFVDHTELGCIYANREVLRMFEMSWEDFQGFGWANAILPADMETLREAIERYEHEKGTIDVQYRIQLPSGGLRALRVIGTMVLDDDGEQLGSVMIGRDVTEERAAQDRTVQSQKLEAIGRLAGRVAHDFNNVLTPIVCAASLLELEELSPSGREHLEMIVQGVQHAAGMTRQLLGLSRQEVRRPRTVQLDRELRALHTMLKQLMGEAIDLRLHLDAEGAHVGLAKHELGQIVLNLCVNARDAIGGEGRVEVRTRQIGSLTTLIVSDTGPGIPVDVQQKMFDPFFTTKPEDRGTGLGLSTVQDLVHRAGGKIRVFSQLGKPTELQISLPAIASSPDELRADADGADLPPQRILIVDDNAPLRQTLAYVLALRKHAVKTAATWTRGLACLREEAFDVLVTDVLLPDGRGDELVVLARAAQPGLMVTYMSGYAGPDFHKQALSQPHTAFLQKPFHPNRLAAVLASLYMEREARSTG